MHGAREQKHPSPIGRRARKRVGVRCAGRPERCVLRSSCLSPPVRRSGASLRGEKTGRLFLLAKESSNDSSQGYDTHMSPKRWIFLCVRMASNYSEPAGAYSSTVDHRAYVRGAWGVGIQRTSTDFNTTLTIEDVYTATAVISIQQTPLNLQYCNQGEAGSLVTQ